MSKYSCQSCGKQYKTRSGLWKHNKRCIGIDESSNMKVADKKHKLKKLQLDIKQLELQNSMITYNQEVLIEKFLSQCQAMNIKDFNKKVIHNSTEAYCSKLNDITEIINKPLKHVVKEIVNNAVKLCDDILPFYCISNKKDEFVVYENDYWNYKNVNEKLIYILYRIRNSLIGLLKVYEKYNDISQRQFCLYERIINYIMNSTIGDGTDIEKNNIEIIEQVIKPIIIRHCLVANKM